jgi:DNA-binding CsgD family transcriptional regulator
MNDKTKNISSIDRKLSIVISLLLKMSNNGSETTLRDQIRDLSSFGLAPIEIADILGKKGKYINKELSMIRKEVKGGK